MGNYLNTIYDKTKAFNDIAGNSGKLDEDGIRVQYKVIVEEVSEIGEGIDANDAKELLDGVIDSFVTLCGLATKLEALGYDMQTAAFDTCMNNLSKFPESEQVAIDTVAMYAEQGIQTSYYFNETYGKYVILDTNGKIRKPVGFVSNDLSHCIPMATIQGE